MSDTLPAAPYRVDELSIEDGLDIAMWRTPGPWAVEDSLTSPRPDEGYWAVRSANNALVGYCVFGEKARPLGLPETHLGLAKAAFPSTSRGEQLIPTLVLRSRFLLETLELSGRGFQRFLDGSHRLDLLELDVHRLERGCQSLLAVDARAPELPARQAAPLASPRRRQRARAQPARSVAGPGLRRLS